MTRTRIPGLLCALLVGACGSVPGLHVEPRPDFETVRGLSGGNEFSAVRTEPAGAGPVADAAGRAPVPVGPAAPAPAPTPVPAPLPTAISVPPVAVPTPARSAPPVPDAPIVIDANAFGAVFGSARGPLHPSAEQLLQLDSLSLVVPDSLRAELQTRILACRRAGEACRLAAKP